MTNTLKNEKQMTRYDDVSLEQFYFIALVAFMSGIAVFALVKPTEYQCELFVFCSGIFAFVEIVFLGRIQKLNFYFIRIAVLCFAFGGILYGVFSYRVFIL